MDAQKGFWRKARETFLWWKEFVKRQVNAGNMRVGGRDASRLNGGRGAGLVSKEIAEEAVCEWERRKLSTRKAALSCLQESVNRRNSGSGSKEGPRRGDQGWSKRLGRRDDITQIRAPGICLSLCFSLLESGVRLRVVATLPKRVVYTHKFYFTPCGHSWSHS